MRTITLTLSEDQVNSLIETVIGDLDALYKMDEPNDQPLIEYLEELLKTLKGSLANENTST